MLRDLLVVLLLPGALRAAPAAATQPTSRPASLIVATYNINYGLAGDAQLRAITDAIDQTHADVIAIQEGNPAIYKHLRQHFAKTYPYAHFHPTARAGGFGWLSRLPLTNKRIIPRKFGWFDSAAVEINLAGQTLTLASVHLQPFNGLTDDTGAGQALRIFGKTEVIRQQEIEWVHSKLPDEGPVIILGDFNSLPTMAAPSFLRDKGFTDSYASVVKDADDGKHPTWQSLDPGKKLRYRIDYIWHTPELKTINSQVLSAGPSDHYPVVSELQLLPAPSRNHQGPVEQ